MNNKLPRTGVAVFDYFENRERPSSMLARLNDRGMTRLDAVMSFLFYAAFGGLLLATLGILSAPEGGTPKQPTPVTVEAPTSSECGK